MASVLVQAVEQPATTVLALLLVAVFGLLHARRLGYADVGLSYDRVVAHRELWRCLSAQLCHIDLLHLAFNLSALWSLGLVERAPGLGSLYFLQHTALLLLLSPAICLLLYHLLIAAAHREQYRATTAVGYSCVLFGWMALLATASPGGLTLLPLFGLASVPLWATPWASLALTSLLIPQASFVGHLAGILAGYLLAFRLLAWVPPAAAIALLAAAALASAAQAAAQHPGLAAYLRRPGSGGGAGSAGAWLLGGGGDVEGGGGSAPR